MLDAGTQILIEGPLRLVTNQGAYLKYCLTLSRAPTGGPRIEPMVGDTHARTENRQPPPELLPLQYVGRPSDARAREQRPSSAQYAACKATGAPSRRSPRLGDPVGRRRSNSAAEGAATGNEQPRRVNGLPAMWA